MLWIPLAINLSVYNQECMSMFIFMVKAFNSDLSLMYPEMIQTATSSRKAQG